MTPHQPEQTRRSARPVSPIDDFHAVIPAGGSGTRLWPMSREVRPKFLLDLTGAGRSLLQATYDRVSRLSGPQNVMVVTGGAHEKPIQEQLPSLADTAILTEPSPRDSMAAIGLAAAVLQQRHGDVLLGSFAADHVITDLEGFDAAIREAVTAARQGYVVTIGISATRPSTAFGYIHSGELLDLPGCTSVRSVESFTEKPDASTARNYLSTGEYRWNAGMFISKVSVLLGHLRDQRPDLHAGLMTIAAAWDTDRRESVLAEVWPRLEKIAIDHAVAEPVAQTGGVAVVPGNFGWDDVGDFNSLAALLPSDDNAGSKVVGDHQDVVRVQSAGSVVVPNSGRLVTILGLDDVVVVDTPDALLVTTRARAQQVKDMVTELRDRGLENYL
ncbi:mannose-1-phosphate guanylyltransferase [Jonesia quinghaiensis]|uniref:mannose-1-phosphate guanylyltransferase n=1 Tax=Jonesia quinghaiensis TaxID=262806 RepID=UPI00055CF8FD|nr:mannose-1-phosphate guanylyltransferase [Jonesia quinghaiensis]